VFNEPPTLEHWRFLFAETLYPRWLANTLLVGVAVVAITLVLSVPAAYGLARLTGRWGERAGIAMFLMYLVPPTLLFIPMSRVVAVLQLQDSLWSLILVYPTFTVPFATWLLMGFFKSIPKDLEEAAMIDGLSRFAAFREGRGAGVLLGTRDGVDLRVHAGAPGVRLRADVPLVGLEADGRRRRPDLFDPRRRFLLGRADGGLPGRVRPGRDRLQPLPGPPDPGLHVGAVK
jgi:ABC-type polysaccharide transport system permease subunit